MPALKETKIYNITNIDTSESLVEIEINNSNHKSAIFVIDDQEQVFDKPNFEDSLFTRMRDLAEQVDKFNETPSNIFGLEFNIKDVFDYKAIPIEVSNQYKNLLFEYNDKINYLISNIFPKKFLNQQSLKIIRNMYAKAIAEKNTILSNHNRIQIPPTNLLPKPLPTQKWVHDRNNLGKEKSIRFLDRVWGDAIVSKQIKSRNELRNHDEELYSVINTYFNRAEKNKKTFDKIPHYLQVWLTDKAVRSTQELDDLLEKYNIKSPKDAYRKGLHSREAHRLYNAAKRRMNSSGVAKKYR